MGKDDEQSVLKMLTEEKRVVTAKYCSHRLHINPRESKKLLASVYEAHKCDKSIVPVFAVYYAQKSDSGEDAENEVAIEKFEMKLVQGDELELSDGEKELYALAPHLLEDVASLCFSTDALCLRQLLNDDPHCLATISCSALKSNCSAPPVSSQPKLASDAPVAQSKPSSTVVEATSKPAAEKKAAPAASVNKGAIASMFSKQQSVPKEAKKAEVDKKGAESEKSVKMEVPSKVTSPQKKKNQEDDEPQIVSSKKKTRRVVVEDDDDEGEDVVMKEPAPAKSPAKEKEVETMTVDEERTTEEEAPPASQTSTASDGTGNGARRLVEHTYVDDEGYFVTEKAWTHDSAAPAAKVPAETASSTTKAAPAAKAPAPKAASKAAKDQGKGKQTSLTSFFKKV